MIVERLEPPAWNDRVQAIRERIGLRAISMETGGREVYAALGRNEIVAVVFDRPLRSGGVPVTFFGAETRVPEGVARMALRTGAAIVGAVGVRRGDQIVAEWLPLLGITYDAKDDLIDVALGQEMQLDHLIRQPQQISVQEGKNGIETIAVVAADGMKQLLRLKEPLMLAAGSREPTGARH